MRIDRLSYLAKMQDRLFVLFLSLSTEKAVRLRCIRFFISFCICLRKKRTAYSDTSCSDRDAFLVDLWIAEIDGETAGKFERVKEVNDGRQNENEKGLTHENRWGIDEYMKKDA